MSVIPKFMIDSVVAIGVNNDTNMVWIGTGFLVGRKEKEDKSKSTVYLVTNKHVVDNQKKIWIRFNSNRTKIKDYSIDLLVKNEKKYTSHDTADVIAIQIAPGTLEKDDSCYGFIDLQTNALSVSEMIDTEVTEGNLVYSLGFPMNIVESNRKEPICRLGCISRIANEEENPMSFLIDAQVFPGNSGGPVINRPELMSIKGTNSNASANLIGIVCSYVTYRESFKSVQTGEITSIKTENSGLAVVCPVDYIREVVENEYKRGKN